MTYGLFFKNNLGVGVELNYLNLGCDYVDMPNDGINDDYVGKVDLHMNLKYLSAPVTINYALFDRKLVFKAGFYASVLLKGELTSGSSDPVNWTKKMQSMDYGLNFGLESNFPASENVYLTLNGTLTTDCNP